MIFTLQGLDFATDSFELTDATKEKLGEAIAALEQNAEIRVQIEGHTDNTGAEGCNVQLSGNGHAQSVTTSSPRGSTQTTLSQRDSQARHS